MKMSYYCTIVHVENANSIYSYKKNILTMNKIFWNSLPKKPDFVNKFVYFNKFVENLFNI